MDNRFKHRFSRIFRSSLSSCRDRNFSDVAEKAVFSHRNHSDLSSRMSEDPLLWSSHQKARPFPSICRPRRPESIYAIDHNCIMMTTSRPRRKLSARNSPFVFPDDFGGRAYCPPASPASPPLLSTAESNNFDFYERRKKKRKEKKGAVTKNQQKAKKRSVHGAAMIFSSSSQESFSYRRSWWSSSDEEDRRGNETDTLFSSRSLSSESSSSRRRNSSQGRSKLVADRKTGVVATDRRSTKMKDSFAVVKSSSDPYNDFRTSMVEMILEKQIFSATGLEQLLQCFLSLNSNSHHRIIVEVFTEIYEALFSDWC